MLIIYELHKNVFIWSPQLTLVLLRREFSILRARVSLLSMRRLHTKEITSACTTHGWFTRLLSKFHVTCIRRNGNVDYVGRSRASHKVYIAFFTTPNICMTTKAIHIELVLDCSFAVFISGILPFYRASRLPNRVILRQRDYILGHEMGSDSFRHATRSPEFADYLAGVLR